MIHNITKRSTPLEAAEVHDSASVTATVALAAVSPMLNPTEIKGMDDLVQGLGRCSVVSACCVSEGLDRREPATGKTNRTWLQEEIADVFANIAAVAERHKLDMVAIMEGADKKLRQIKTWHAMA